MKLSKNATRGLTYVLIVVVMVAGAQLVIGTALGSSPVYVVVSKSMVPTLQIGDLVVVRSVPFDSIHVGQVIVYVKPTDYGTCAGLTIVHRVVNITSTGLITQGDDRVTNPLPDEPYEWPPVPAQCVKGVVWLAIPYLGLISMLIPYPWNYALVALILIFVFVSEFRGSPERKPESQQAASGASGPLDPPTQSPGPSPQSPGP